ncbi:MAG TPA: efflux RND transporter periplasmic adaptor subunit [Phycisphaerales bacterium]|nr:efflux RND transporter periplasmic adaptor subunit [Phycisphaerales bacterium]
MTTSEKGKSRRTGRPGIVRMLVSAVVRLIAASVVVFGATLAYKHLLATSPTAARAKPPRQARLVEAVELKKSAHTVTVKQNGQVIPAQEVTLQPQVSGKIVEVSEYVVPGTAVKAGQKLIGIDRRDYEILVKQRHADVVRVQRDLKVEHGNQAVARQEYELLGEVLGEQDRELVLREPQLAAAEAALESAQAAYEKAQLDLGRCEIAAPFNAIVQQRHVDLGATVSSNTPLVTLIATDEAWVEVKVPIGQLAWLAIPRANGQAGSDVTLHNPLAWGADNVRTGRVLRLYGEVERQGQMAKLLVLVDDPLCLKPEHQGRPKLLMDSYVSAEIEGRRLTDVFEIPRPYFREGDAVWIMNEKDELEIRPVEVAFRGQETVYVSGGVVEGERLVTTDIAAPVAGMPLRLDGGSGAAGGDGPPSEGRRSGS